MGFLDSYAPQIKSILRIVTGLLFFSVGLAKIVHFPSVRHVRRRTDPLIGLEGSAGMIELVGGGLVCLGLFSRYAAFICSGEMAVAYFTGALGDRHCQPAQLLSRHQWRRGGDPLLLRLPLSRRRRTRPLGAQSEIAPGRRGSAASRLLGQDMLPPAAIAGSRGVQDSPNRRYSLARCTRPGSRRKFCCAPMPRACFPWRSGATIRRFIGCRRRCAASSRSDGFHVPAPAGAHRARAGAFTSPPTGPSRR